LNSQFGRLRVKDINLVLLTAVLTDQMAFNVAPNVMRVQSAYRHAFVDVSKKGSGKTYKYREYDLSHTEEASNIFFSKVSLVI
jgi:hypothetical protein